MKSKLIGFWLFLAFTACASDTNELAPEIRDVLLRLAKVDLSSCPLQIGGTDDKTPVRVMEWLESETLRDFFPNQTVYRLISTWDPHEDPLSFSALLLDTNGVPTHLKSDKDVAEFFADLTVRANIGTKSNALKLVRAFAVLRSYKIVESTPDPKDTKESENQPPPLASDFKFFVEDRKDQWRVYATFFKSAYIGTGRYERYIFKIYKRPGAGFSFLEPVVIRLRNYGY
jgi:hypothetical protein